MYFIFDSKSLLCRYLQMCFHQKNNTYKKFNNFRDIFFTLFTL